MGRLNLYTWATFVLLLIHWLVNDNQIFAKDYYVSTTGNDAYDGLTPANAWKTISKVNTAFSSLIAGDNILFHNGETFTGKIIVGKSGTSSKPITITSYGSGVNPVITGLTDISGGWNVYSGNIYRKAVTTDSDIKYLTINGTQYLKGKYPSSGWNRITAGGSLTQFADNVNLTQANDYWNGAEVVVRVNLYWTQIKDVTDFIHSSGTVFWSGNTYSNIDVNAGYFFQNHIGCLLDNGDWYFSGDSIYIYSTSDPNVLTIRASMYNNGVTIENNHDITIQNLTFAGFNQSSIYCNKSYNINITNNILTDCVNGVNINSTNNYFINNNKLNKIGLFGINILNSDIGLISENEITDIGIDVGYGNQGLTALYAFDCDSLLIYKNYIDSIGYSGINTTWCDRVYVERNRVTNYCQVLDDGGGIYAYQCSPSFVSNYHGITWKNNFTMAGGYSRVLESSSALFTSIFGLYMDGGSTDFTVTDNISVHNSTNFYINNTRRSYIRNNYTTGAYAIKGQNAGYEFYISNEVPSVLVDSNIFYSNKWISNWLPTYTNRVVNTFEIVSSQSHNIYDSNYYACATGQYYNPDTLVVRNNNTYYGISQWIASNGETNEKTSSIKWSALYSNTSQSEYVTYDYNFSDTPRSYNFETGWTYFNPLTGTEIISYTLRPYEGSVLFRINNLDLGKPVIPPTNNPPEINNQEFQINEEEYTPENLGKVIANPGDIGQLLTYQIVSGNESGLFNLDSQNGYLSTQDDNIFSYSPREYSLTVKVEDNGEIPKNNSAIVTVKLLSLQTTVYIDPESQNDPLQDGSIDHPLSSWSQVVWKAGKTYMQKKGTISVEDKISIGASNITIGSYGEGEQPVIQTNSSDFAFQAFEKNNIIFNDIHFVAEEAVSCIYILGEAEACRIEKCTFEGAANGVRTVDAKTVTICYNSFINCAEAIYSVAENNKVYYNVFRNNQTAININSYLSNVELYNNVFYNNLKGLAASYSNLTLYNNIFYLENNGNIALNVKGDKINSDNNIFYPEQAEFISVSDVKYSTLNEYQKNLGLDLNSFNQDPKFIDVLSGNFKVNEYSPAINAGKIVDLLEDFYGKKVPFGTTTDIGLDESGINPVDPLTSIDEAQKSNGNETSIVVYPNPSNGRFDINLKGIKQEFSKLSIIDLAGKIIYEENYYPNNSEFLQHIDLSNILNGIYFVILKMEDKIYNQLIVIR